jgi:hypothetical protein
VPKAVRKQPLPADGCNYCGCNGIMNFDNYLISKNKKVVTLKILDIPTTIKVNSHIN